MKYKPFASGVLIALLGAGLAACGGTPAASPAPAPAAQATAAPQPTVEVPVIPPAQEIELGVSGSGEFVAEQDADLVFNTQGTVDQVKVKEGDKVKQGDVLAILDIRPFDNALHQAEAALAAAQAQEAALNEPPKSADAAAARAQLQQAQAALQSVRQGPKAQDLQTADAAVALAETSLQSTRDKLSQAKTAAEAGIQQAVDALTQAQARYAQAKNNYERARESGKDPVVPSKGTDPTTGKDIPNKVNDAQLETYYTAFVQAEAAMHQAETAVQQAVVAAEEARKAEVLGIQAAEQQVTQAHAAADKLRLPEGTVKSRINRGRTELARQIRRMREELESGSVQIRRTGVAG